jgi:hypothetical protein
LLVEDARRFLGVALGLGLDRTVARGAVDLALRQDALEQLMLRATFSNQLLDAFQQLCGFLDRVGGIRLEICAQRRVLALDDGAVRRIDAKFRLYQSVIMRLWSAVPPSWRASSRRSIRRQTPTTAISTVIARISRKPIPRRLPMLIFEIKPYNLSLSQNGNLNTVNFTPKVP